MYQDERKHCEVDEIKKQCNS